MSAVSSRINFKLVGTRDSIGWSLHGGVLTPVELERSPMNFGGSTKNKALHGLTSKVDNIVWHCNNALASSLLEQSSAVLLSQSPALAH